MQISSLVFFSTAIQTVPVLPSPILMKFSRFFWGSPDETTWKSKQIRNFTFFSFTAYEPFAEPLGTARASIAVPVCCHWVRQSIARLPSWRCSWPNSSADCYSNGPAAFQPKCFAAVESLAGGEDAAGNDDFALVDCRLHRSFGSSRLVSHPSLRGSEPPSACGCCCCSVAFSSQRCRLDAPVDRAVAVLAVDWAPLGAPRECLVHDGWFAVGWSIWVNWNVRRGRFLADSSCRSCSVTWNDCRVLPCLCCRRWTSQGCCEVGRWFSDRGFVFGWFETDQLTEKEVIRFVLQRVDNELTGIGRFEFFMTWLFPTIEAHCRGRPMYRPSFLSKPVCTRCSKLDGNDIWGFFFFLENIFDTKKFLMSMFQWNLGCGFGNQEIMTSLQQ